MNTKIFKAVVMLFFVAFVLACTLLLGGYGIAIWGSVVIYLVNRSYEQNQANDPND